MAKENLRMCLICKNMQPKRSMIRIVKNENNIKIDTNGKIGGRGAYICTNDACLENFKKSKCLNRAYKCEIKPEVYDKLYEELNDIKSKSNKD